MKKGGLRQIAPKTAPFSIFAYSDDAQRKPSTYHL